MSWSLKFVRGEFAIGELDVFSCKLRLRSLASDELTLTSSSPLLASLEEQVQLLFNGQKKFVGKCKAIDAKISGASEIYIYTFKNVWLDLEELPFMQEWSSVEASAQTAASFNLYKTKNLFGMNFSGQKANSAVHIAEIIEYAISKDANIALGDCEAVAQFPNFEAHDLTCAQALLKILHWSPDIVGFFDYSQTMPTLNLKKRSSLPEKSLQNLKIKSLQYSPCRDLLVNGVNIIYEKSHTIDGESYSSYECDKYPTNVDCSGLKCLSFTVELSGERQNTLIQKIETSTIDTSSALWWRQKLAFLNNYSDADFEIENVTRISTLPRELVSGTVTEWMLKSVEEDIVCADISIYKNNVKILTRKVSVKLIATNASSQNYIHTAVYQNAEPRPANLAKNLYDALSVLQYKGSIKIADAQNENLFASKISMANKFQNAIVCDTLLDIFTGNLTANFGPQKYLQGADFAELFRISKSQKSSPYTSRNSAKQIKQAPVELAPSSNTNDTMFEDSQVNVFEVVNPLENGGKIVLDPKLILSENSTMQPRKYAVVENGILKFAYLLSSESFAEEVEEEEI